MQNSLYQALLEPHSPPPVGLTVWNGSDPAVGLRSTVIISWPP
ncbi:Uncharacterised protein [Escherichia coli]|nr:Uncharacterised protein [Escherichia coli]